MKKLALKLVMAVIFLGSSVAYASNAGGSDCCKKDASCCKENKECCKK